jgi:hypothetical protein
MVYFKALIDRLNRGSLQRYSSAEMARLQAACCLNYIRSHLLLRTGTSYPRCSSTAWLA